MSQCGTFCDVCLKLGKHIPQVCLNHGDVIVLWAVSVNPHFITCDHLERMSGPLVKPLLMVLACVDTVTQLVIWQMAV